MPPLCKTIETTRRRAFRRSSQGRLRRRAPESPAMDAREDSAMRTILGNRWMPFTCRRPKAFEAARASLSSEAMEFPASAPNLSRSDARNRPQRIPAEEREHGSRGRGRWALGPRNKASLTPWAVSRCATLFAARAPTSGRCGNSRWNGEREILAPARGKSFSRYSKMQYPQANSDSIPTRCCFA